MRRFIVVLWSVLLTATAWAQSRQTLRRLTTEDGLPSNTVRNIVQDRQGFIWFGTDGGLCRFDGSQVRTFRIAENGMDQFVMSLRADGDSLVVSTPNGVFSFVPLTEQFHRLPQHQPQLTGRGDRLQTRDGHLWIGTWEEGLALMSGDGRPRQVISPLRDGLGHHIHKIFEYDERYLLIGCDEGLLAYDRTTGQASLWDAPKFVYAIERDHEGGLWVGTFYDGVCYLNDTAQRFGGQPSHVIARFCQDAEGRLWVASDDAGLRCLVGGAEHDYPCSNVLQHLNTHALLSTGDALWVGTYSTGVYRLRGGELQHYDKDDGLYDNSSYVIHQDPQHRLWVATMEGLCRYDEQADRFIPFKHLDGVAISMASEGRRLWVATQGAGLYCYDGSKWRQYRHRNDTTSIADDQVNCLLVARDGRLWVATQSGLCLYRPEDDRFSRVTTGAVGSLVESARGDELWLATAKGVQRLRPTTGHTVSFTREDGLTSLQFQPDAAFRDARGYIYFGTANGYCRFLPTGIRTNKLRPRVCITGLEIFNRSISVGDDLMPQSLTDGGRLELSYSDRMFSLHYTALSYVAPSKNQYAYRLDGFDREWNEVGSQTKATYTNLPAGTYTFRVKATNSDGLWSDREATLTIVVSPPWWWSWPARLLYAVLAAGAVWYYVRLRLRRAEHRHQEEIRRLSEAKEREAREARLSFFTMIAHEIRTPVSLIIGPLEELKATPAATAEPLSSHLDIIDRNAHRLLELVNQLLDFRKVEQKDMPMRFGPCNVSQLMHGVCERFAPAFAQSGRRFTVSYPDEHLTAIIDAEAVTKVVSNLLTNANKYTKSRVDVRCFEEPGTGNFRIEVEDDGVGISPADRDRIFRPFYQAADNKPGTGIGLAIVHNIVSQHGGHISVESEVGQGSRFVVVLPIKTRPQAHPQPLPKGGEQDSATTLPSRGEGSGAGSSLGEGSGVGSSLGEGPGTGSLLLVDDQQDMLDYLAGHFAQRYSVATAHDGLEALDKLAQGGVSLIVSDWMMPHMDGAELCRRVRQDAATSHIPFIMLTAKTDNDSKVEGMDVGADAYVEKPFSIQYLEGIIRNTLEMRRRLLQTFASKPMEPVTTIASNPTDNDFLKRMNDLIEQNFANPELNVNFLAAELAISRSGLFAKIKSLADVTPNEMIQIVRLKRAAQLLRETSLTVSEVCYRVGFSSPSYFTKCFSKQFGIKPTEWKEGKNPPPD